MTITIYHNPRCSKSRATLEIIQSKGITPNIVEYLHTPPDPDTLVKIARLIGVPLGELLRRGEDDGAEAAPFAAGMVSCQFKGKGKWSKLWLSLGADGPELKFREGGQTGDVVRTANVGACAVSIPKSARKGHEHP